MTDNDNAVLFNDVGEALAHFRDAVLAGDVDEQRRTMLAFADLIAARVAMASVAMACPICATRRAAILN